MAKKKSDKKIKPSKVLIIAIVVIAIFLIIGWLGASGRIMLDEYNTGKIIGYLMLLFIFYLFVKYVRKNKR